MMGLLWTATVVAVLALLHGDRTGSRALHWGAKLVASSGFVAVALVTRIHESGHGCWVLAGLLLSWIGDVLIVHPSRGAFLTALVSFLLAHLSYAAGFYLRGYETWITALTFFLLSVLAGMIFRWLEPGLGPLATPVRFYMMAINLMVAFSLGTWSLRGNPWIPLGAVLFWISDLSVARDRFVAPGTINRLWGLPVYYFGQLVLATFGGR